MRRTLPGVLIAAALSGCIVELSHGPVPPDPFTNLVFVTSGEVGAPLVPVVVVDSAGGVVSVVKTGIDGNARVVVPAGGAVMILESGPSYRNIRGFQSPPVDAVLRGRVVAGPIPTPPLTVTALSASFTNVPPGTVRVDWTANCHDFATSNTSGAVAFGVERCLRSEHEAQHDWNVLAIAVGSSNLALAWGLTSGIADVDGGTTAFSVDLSHTAFENVLFQGPLTSATISGVVGPDLSWRRFTYAASATGYALRVPRGLTTAWRGDAQTFSPEPGGGIWALETWDVPEPFPAVPFALDSALLATPSAGALSLADPARPVVAWSVTDAPRGDFRVVNLKWTVSGSALAHAMVWVSPPELPPTFRLPVVPSQFSEWSPATATSVDLVGIGYLDTENVDGYAGTFAEVPPPPGHRSSRQEEFVP